MPNLTGHFCQLALSRSALRAQAGENGARGESRAECAEEKKDLEEQNTRD